MHSTHLRMVFQLVSLIAVFLTGSACVCDGAPAQGAVKDLAFFLRRLTTLDHLPELEPSHTAMSSTWDRSGGNLDGWDFKEVKNSTNTLLNVEGPGCVHRIFTGWLGKDKDVLGRPGPARTRLQVFLDRDAHPTFDLPVEQFFDDRRGPFPYPLVFHKTYPGILFPIPRAKHCRMQLVNPADPNWGNFWQITYTTYGSEVKVKSLRWPLNQGEKEELNRVREAWLEAESRPPAALAERTQEQEPLMSTFIAQTSKRCTRPSRWPPGPKDGLIVSLADQVKGHPCLASAGSASSASNPL